jgi:hypothetical protein
MKCPFYGVKSDKAVDCKGKKPFKLLGNVLMEIFFSLHIWSDGTCIHLNCDLKSSWKTRLGRKFNGIKDFDEDPSFNLELIKMW